MQQGEAVGDLLICMPAGIVSKSPYTNNNSNNNSNNNIRCNNDKHSKYYYDNDHYYSRHALWMPLVGALPLRCARGRMGACGCRCSLV